MNRKIIAVLMLVLTISFLLMGALYGKTAETQKGIEVSFGTMVDGEFVSNETGTLGGNQRKYEILQSPVPSVRNCPVSPARFQKLPPVPSGSLLPGTPL